MKSDFVQPKFDGARFLENTLPLEVAKDLVAYETLVLELAKRLYLNDHRDRKRVPKGFGADFHLHLERIDEGSAKPLLALVVAGAATLGGLYNNYFEQSRELIAECIAAPADGLPRNFPRELLPHFNQLGRSLLPGERMELSRTGGGTAVLTQERRKQLVLAADSVYEQEVELSGYIEEVDWSRQTFRLRTSQGAKIEVSFPEGFQEQARSSLGRERHLLTLRAVCTFNSNEQLQKVISVESAIDVQEDFQIASAFDDLRALQDGWFDGRGVALNPESLEQVASRLVGRYPEKLPLPMIVPTPEGNLLLEWQTEGDPSVDLNLSNFKANYHAFDSNFEDVEMEFDLSSDTEWIRLFNQLARTTGDVEA